MYDRAVLFDADGMTLIPKRFSDQIQRDYGISWEIMKLFFAGPFVQCQLGKADLKQELSSVIHDWGWQGSVTELLEYWLSVGNVPNPAILTIANELRLSGVKCFLATNQEKYRAKYLWEKVHLNEYFDALLVSADIGHRKNEIAFFEEAYRRINASGRALPKDVILFVDHDEENLAAAKTFGFNTHHYHDAQTFKKMVYEGTLTSL